MLFPIAIFELGVLSQQRLREVAQCEAALDERTKKIIKKEDQLDKLERRLVPIGTELQRQQRQLDQWAFSLSVTTEDIEKFSHLINYYPNVDQYPNLRQSLSRNYAKFNSHVSFLYDSFEKQVHPTRFKRNQLESFWIPIKFGVTPLGKHLILLSSFHQSIADCLFGNPGVFSEFSPGLIPQLSDFSKGLKKLYLSSPDVCHGEWIQVGGQGTFSHMNIVQVTHFIAIDIKKPKFKSTSLHHRCTRAPRDCARECDKTDPEYEYLHYTLTKDFEYQYKLSIKWE